MYLIFSMLRPDVLPLDDAGATGGYEGGLEIDGEDFNRRARAIAEAWRPNRSMACWYLYAYLDRHHKNALQGRQSVDAGQLMATIG